MIPGKPAWVVMVGAACSLATTRDLAAQTTGTVDVGVSAVRYDGFLPSGAASLTPAVSWERPGAALTARGTYVRFESGHRSLLGLVAASVLTPPTLLPSRWRGELALSAGASSYADFASFWHATGEARMHFIARGRGAWIGGTTGRTSYGTIPRPVAVGGIGVWTRRAALTLAASASRSFVGDTAYTDLASTARTSRGPLALDASIGTRISSRGAGHGVYGEGSATLTLADHIALFVSGGRYPTDPISGSVAGRYVSAGVRLRTTSPRPPPFRGPLPSNRWPAAGDGEPEPTARLEVRRVPDGAVRIVLHAPAAVTAELAGDFTDWRPVPLRRVAEGEWETVVRIPSGLHRINVRIDGGGWTVPAGTTRSADEFGGAVGIVAVP